MPNNFDYNTDIPNAPNNPSNDQPLMKVNTNSINSLIGIDHVGFSTNGSGIHKQVTLINEAAPGLGDGAGVLYANLQNSQSWPFWQNGAGTASQIISQVPTSTTVGPSSGYVTSLPGGLTVSAGFCTGVIDGATISILTSFTHILSLTMTPLQSSTSGTDRALVAQPRSLNIPGSTIVVNLQDVNNNRQLSGRTVYFYVVGV